MEIFDSQHTDELAITEAIDAGKPITDCREFDLPDVLNTIRWYAEAADLPDLAAARAALMAAATPEAALAAIRAVFSGAGLARDSGSFLAFIFVKVPDFLWNSNFSCHFPVFMPCC